MELFKLIVDDVDGIQRVIKVSKSGGYRFKEKILWDEREDGMLSREQLENVGGYKKESGQTVFYQALFNQNQAKISAKKQELDRPENAKKALKEVDFDSITTISKLKEVVKQIIDARI